MAGLSPRSPLRRVFDRLAVLGVALPVLVLAAVTATVPEGPWGDQAVILLSTDQAAGLHQLVGPYSRFGWNHPGPLYFYLLALPYKLLHSGERGLAVGSVLLAGGFAVGTVLAAGALAGRSAARWAAVLSLIELAALSPPVVAEVWNPVVIIVPTGTFLVCCAALALGRWWGLPAAMGVGSFLLQTDVSTGVLVGGVGAAAVAAGLVTQWRGSRRASAPEGVAPEGAPEGVAPEGAPGGLGWRGPLGAAGLGILLTLVLWAPPLIQEATHHPGNLTLVLRFFAHPPAGLGHQTWRATLGAVGGALYPPMRGRLGAGAPGAVVADLAVVIALAAAVTVAVVGWHRRRPEAAALGAVAGLGLLAGVESAHRVAGPLFSYLTGWCSVVALVLLLGAALVLAPSSGTAWRWLQGAAPVVLAALVFVTASLVDRPYSSPDGRQVQALWARTAPALSPSPVHLDIATRSEWPWAAGLLVYLVKSGHHPTVEPTWLFLFGSEFRAGPSGPGAIASPATEGAGRTTQVLTIYSPGSGPAPAGRLVASVKGTSVYLSATPG